MESAATLKVPQNIEMIQALFFHDLCWQDCEQLLKHPLGKAVAQQLIRSAGSISANIEEGYGRGYGKDRLRFQVLPRIGARKQGVVLQGQESFKARCFITSSVSHQRGYSSARDRDTELYRQTLNIADLPIC